ncbi:MAG TPA: DUF6498-containing protein [Pseudomonadales bacterium]
MQVPVAELGDTDTRRRLALAALVGANLLPLVGVLLWGWDVGALVVLYWSENLIIGAYTLVKMLVASPLGGLFGGVFFLIHYGGFCAVHGMLVLMLAVEQQPHVLEGERWPSFLVFVQLLIDVVRQVLSIAPSEWLVVFGALAVSHGLSLALNYFAGGEYRGETVKSLMMAPYKRILILHFAIILGGIGVGALGSPLPLLVLLVSLKLVVDVWLHRREHRTSAARAEVSSTAASS